MQELYYNSEGTILFRKVIKDCVDIDEVLDSWNKIVNGNYINENVVGIINDMQLTKLKIDVSSLESIINIFRKYNDVFRNIKIAVVVNTPKNTVLPMFAESEYSEEFKIRPFYKIENAEKWILNK